MYGYGPYLAHGVHYFLSLYAAMLQYFVATCNTVALYNSGVEGEIRTVEHADIPFKSGQTMLVFLSSSCFQTVALKLVMKRTRLRE